MWAFSTAVLRAGNEGVTAARSARSLCTAVKRQGIGVGDNQFLRYWDSLDNGLSNNEVRKVPWVHVRAVLNLLIPIIAAMLVTEFDHQRTFQVLHCGR